MSFSIEKLASITTFKNPIVRCLSQPTKSPIKTGLSLNSINSMSKISYRIIAKASNWISILQTFQMPNYLFPLMSFLLLIAWTKKSSACLYRNKQLQQSMSIWLSHKTNKLSAIELNIFNPLLNLWLFRAKNYLVRILANITYPYNQGTVMQIK